MQLAQEKGCCDDSSADGETVRAEVHWYEAHGIGKAKLKVKRWL
jgi:hypothetical protein